MSFHEPWTCCIIAVLQNINSYHLVCVCARSVVPTLLPGFPVHRIFQARVLAWVAVSYSRGTPDPGIEPWSLASPAFSSVQLLSHVWLFATPGLQHTMPLCPLPTPRVYSNSCPLSWWCHPAISSSVIPFSSCPQSFPASGSFQMSQLFVSGGQSIGESASTSVLPMNTQDCFSLGWTPASASGFFITEVPRKSY